MLWHNFTSQRFLVVFLNIWINIVKIISVLNLVEKLRVSHHFKWFLLALTYKALLFKKKKKSNIGCVLLLQRLMNSDRLKIIAG